MISNVSIKDVDDFNKLGLLVNNKFDKLFDLSKLVDSEIDYIFGYYEDNRLYGFIHVIKLYETMDIVNIVVDSDYRNRGIGTKLLEYVVNKFKDINNIMLEVNENNKVAIDFYYKNGFKLISKRNKYYGNDDALILKRDV